MANKERLSVQRSRSGIEVLRELYSRNPVYRELLSQLAAGKLLHPRGDGRPELISDMAVNALRAQYPDCRGSVVDLLKQLARLELGEYIVGRRDKLTRVCWYANPKSVGLVAQGKADEIEMPYLPEQRVKMIRYEFLLRPEMKILFDVPADLTRDEAQRLSGFVATCLIMKS